MPKRILIIDDVHPAILPGLEKLGYAVKYQPDIQRPEILSIIKDYYGVIVRGKTNLDKAFFEAANQLKFIGRAGAGLDQIDVEETEQRNIIIVNAPEGNRDALAEHCIGLILCLLNKIHSGHRQISEGIWNREANRGAELGEMTVGIIGFGHMGEAFSKRLHGFGCNILAYDKYKQGFSNEFVREASLEQIFEQCNLLSLHIPLSRETKGMINRQFIDRFQKNIYIVNTSRGEILPLFDLKVQLSAGKVIGAALDVHEFEKKKSLTLEDEHLFDAIKTSDNVLLTPHVGGWTKASYRKISEVLLEKISKIQMPD